GVAPVALAVHGALGDAPELVAGRAARHQLEVAVARRADVRRARVLAGGEGERQLRDVAELAALHGRVCGLHVVAAVPPDVGVGQPGDLGVEAHVHRDHRTAHAGLAGLLHQLGGEGGLPAAQV